MDERVTALRKRKEALVRELADVDVGLALAEGKLQGVPHYSKIEEAAHALGQELSCRVQERRMAEVVGRQGQQVRCPGCGKWVEGTVAGRVVKSVDGPVKLAELKGYCPSCRRAFFPSA